VRMWEQLSEGPNGHHIILVKNDRGEFYAPRINYRGIRYWNLQEGYLVLVDANVTANWRGAQIARNAPIPMTAGWNIVPYYPTYELTARRNEYYVLSPIINSVILAKDYMGRFMAPARGFSNMPPWRETQGYMIKVTQDVVLRYPAPQGGDAVQPRLEPEMARHYPRLASTSQNMSVLVQSSSGLPEFAG